MFWTCSNTFATCFTSIFVNDCNTVYDMDCIEWTCFHTVTKSKTSVVTGFWSTIWNKCHSGTILNSCVLIVLIRFFTGSGTFYKCCFALAFLCFDTHDLTDLGCNRCSTNRTLIDWSFPFYDSGCKSGTSGISTTTTVISRKSLCNGYFSLIYFYFEFFSGNTKEKSN